MLGRVLRYDLDLAVNEVLSKLWSRVEEIQSNLGIDQEDMEHEINVYVVRKIEGSF